MSRLGPVLTGPDPLARDEEESSVIQALQSGHDAAIASPWRIGSGIAFYQAAVVPMMRKAIAGGRKSQAFGMGFF